MTFGPAVRRTGLTLVVAKSPWNDVEVPQLFDHSASAAVF
jgi:hypothetical protein